MISEGLRRILDNQDWDALTPELEAYASKVVKRLIWRGQRGGLPPTNDGSDFAMEAMCRVYAGRRQWNPTKDPDLFGYLCDVIDSLISEAVNKPENQDKPPGSADTELLIESQSDPHPDASSKLSDDAYVDGFLKAVEDEPDLYRVTECMLDGCTKRADIAARLSLTANDVTKLGRKLERRLTTYSINVYGQPVSSRESKGKVIRNG